MTDDSVNLFFEELTNSDAMVAICKKLMQSYYVEVEYETEPADPEVGIPDSYVIVTKVAKPTRDKDELFKQIVEMLEEEAKKLLIVVDGEYDDTISIQEYREMRNDWDNV